MDLAEIKKSGSLPGPLSKTPNTGTMKDYETFLRRI
jgi:hypothetical protein